MFKNMSLKGKLLGICLLIASFSVAVGTIGYFAVSSVSEKYQRIADVNLPNIASLGDMFAQYRMARIQLQYLGMTGLTAQQEKDAIATLHTSLERYATATKAYEAVPFSPGEGELYEPVTKAWTEYTEFSKRMTALYESGDPSDRAKITSSLLKEDISDRYRDHLRKLIDYHRAASKKASIESQSTARWNSMLMAILVGLALTISSAIALIFSSTLAKILGQLAERLSHGANEVASASTQVSSASESLSSSATEQAAALQETAASVEEMSATLTKNAENADSSRTLSEQSHRVAQKGKEAMDEMIHAIGDINQSNAEIMQQIEASNQEIAEIVKVIAEIGNKTKVINDIVFQTKLLSFNASVEAARAGEHGKGFAVVAEEVGNLAAMSGNSAREISSMLESSIQKVESIVIDSKSKVEVLVEGGKEKVARGTDIAQRCGEVLVEILQNASKVNGRIGDISQACREQENGVKEISKAMAQLDQVTQTNAAASQQAASASSELSAQAESLRSSVIDLLGLVQGGKPADDGASFARHAHPRVSRAIPTRKIESPAGHENVLPLHAAKREAPLKKAAGSDVHPDENDPRFQDV